MRERTLEPMTIEVSELSRCKLYKVLDEGRDTVAVAPGFGVDAIILTSGLEPVDTLSTMEELKALSSWPKDTTLLVWLKGVQMKVAMGEGGTCGGCLREIGKTFESVELCTARITEH